jgi:ubiquinol-cytochrome c reductase cytochrome c1 subunit
MNWMKLLAGLLFVPALAMASGAELKLDQAPINPNDYESLQRGARIFVNYCLNCHSANYMRYSRLEDIGLTEAQIKNNLLFAGEKPGETMSVAMRVSDAKQWFGATPPDLSVISRSRGADWLYTYLRGFYRDDRRPTGWNNIVFDKVGMPHVLWELQGEQILEHDEHGEAKLKLVKAGRMNQVEYDQMVGDLVNYLAWMGEPSKIKRLQTGLVVMLFLVFFFVVAYYLKREFWKDVH